MSKDNGRPAKPLERQVKVGHFMYWRRQTYKIVAIEGTQELELENTVTLEKTHIYYQEIFKPDQSIQDDHEPLFAPTLDKLQTVIIQHRPMPKTTAVLDIPKVFIKKADLIIHTVESVEKRLDDEKHLVELNGGNFQYVPALKRTLARLEEPVGLTCYYKYRRIYRKNQGMRDQIAISLRPKTHGQTKISEQALHFVDTCIMEYYGGPLRINKSTLYALMQDIHKRTHGKWIDPVKCKKDVPRNMVAELLNPRIQIEAILDHPEKAALLNDIEIPSQSWFYEYIKWFEAQPNMGEEVMKSRWGQEAWDDTYRVFDTFVHRAQHPLQYVFADYWRVDTYIVDEETRAKVDRPWLTVLIDAYSRSIVGFALQYEDPCIMSIQNALKHAIWPKDSHLKYGINGENHAFGIPLNLFLDNAWANHSHSLEYLSHDISRDGFYNHIQLQHRPPYKKRYGALIERFFLTLSNKFNEFLFGAIPSNNRKGIKNALEKACLLFEDLDRFVHRLVICYQNTPQKELGDLTPNEKWLEGMEGQLPGVPPLNKEMDRLFWRMHHDKRQITQQGISFRGDKYWSPEISGLPRIDRHGKPIEYVIRYDPSNVSCIALFHDGHWCGDAYSKQRRQSDGTTKAVSLWEHEIAACLSLDRQHYKADTEDFYADALKMGETRSAEKKQIQRELKKSSQKPPRSIAVIEAGSTPDYTELLTGFLEKRR